jgi:ABC-type transporter Mla subunit MlaD
MMNKKCPFADHTTGSRTCKKEECGVYNPVIKGCGLMCSALPMGEELASCRKELAEISGHLATLASVLSSGHDRIIDALEAVDRSLQTQAEYVDNVLVKCEELAAQPEEIPEEVLEGEL